MLYLAKPKSGASNFLFNSIYRRPRPVNNMLFASVFYFIKDDRSEPVCEQPTRATEHFHYLVNLHQESRAQSSQKNARLTIEQTSNIPWSNKWKKQTDIP